MRLIFKCNNCYNVNNFPFKVSNRSQLEREYKKELKITCSNCNQTNHISPNKIVARESRINLSVFVIGLFISLLLGFFTFYSFWKVDDLGINLDVLALIGVVISLPILITGAIISNDRKLVKNFNKHYL